MAQQMRREKRRSSRQRQISGQHSLGNNDIHYMRATITFLIGIVIAMTFSCKPSIPGKYLSQDLMAKILYDYHIAQGIASETRENDTLAMQAYKTKIFEKYGIKESDFDSSMVYYTRHTKLLEEIYTKVSDRLNAESTYLGINTNGNGSFGDITNSADTTNIWQSSQSLLLSPYAATNSFSYDIEADTTFHEGDKLIFDFDTQFIYQDGMRSAIAVMSVTYEGDSIETVTTQVTSTSHYHMQIENSGRLKIKHIKGFLLINNERTVTSATTLKLLIVSGIKMIKMRTTAKDVIPQVPADSVKAEGQAPSQPPLPPKSIPDKALPANEKLKASN